MSDLRLFVFVNEVVQIAAFSAAICATLVTKRLRQAVSRRIGPFLLMYNGPLTPNANLRQINLLSGIAQYD